MKRTEWAGKVTVDEIYEFINENIEIWEKELKKHPEASVYQGLLLGFNQVKSFIEY